MLVWEFTVVHAELLFSVASHRADAPEKEATKDHKETPNIVAPRRGEQHAGTHLATEKGKFTLAWENPSSFFGKRARMFYKVFVADQHTVTQEAVKEELD